jgi:hypothetical protein
MSNLLVTVIAIALIALSVAMGIFYGGTSWSKSTAKGTATTLVSQKEQLKTASTLWKSQHAGQLVASLETLESDRFLSSIPEVKQKKWALNGNKLIIEVDDQELDPYEICDILYQLENGGDSSYYTDAAVFPTCSSISVDNPNGEVCCEY